MYLIIFVLSILATPPPTVTAQQSWCEYQSPSTYVPFEPTLSMVNLRMHFNGAQKGWMLVWRSINFQHLGQVYRTQDSGRTWTFDWQDQTGAYSREGGLRAIHMCDTLTGWIGGMKYYGNSNEGWPYVAKRAWVPGTVGIRWHVQDTKLPAGNFVNAIWAFNPTTVLIGTSKGLIARSSDGGDTWSVLDTLEESRPINEWQFIDDRLGWMLSWDKLFRTNDGGATWQEVSYGKPFALSSVFFIDASTGWIGGAAGRIMKTTDGGATWLSQWSTTGAVIEDIEFINSTVGFAVGGGVEGRDSSRILKTTDGGAQWVPMPHPKDSWIGDIDIASRNNAYVLTGKYFYSYCGDELVSVQEDLPKEPCQCKRTFYDYLGREVNVSASGMLLEYDPCVRKARLVVR